MLDPELFVGFPADSKFLNKIPLSTFDLFIGDNPSFLEEWEGHEGHFIGKRVGNEIELDELKMIEANIYSILKKMAPSHPVEQMPLVLFPIVSHG